MSDMTPKKRAVYLREADKSALMERVADLERAGVKAGQATVLRALMHLTPPDDMFALSAKQILADALTETSVGIRHDTGYRPTIDVTDDEWGRVGLVVERLARRGMTGTHNLVLRALLGSAPRGKALVALLKKFRDEVPNKPRGLSKLRLERKNGSRGPN